MAQFNRNDKREDEYSETVVALNRVSKTVKGGRVMKFSALVVVGDGKGTVGFGLGKASEVRTLSARASRTPRRTSLRFHEGYHYPARDHRRVRCRPCPAQARCSRYRRYRRRCSSCNRRGCRHQGYPHQVPALQQPAERCFRNDQGLKSMRSAAQVAAVRGKAVEEL